MLRLKNVSKFYYNKGVIAAGFNKVSIEFEMGEFVAIVGESGSGKSTLLNVISGLDSYEEGEMYINGEETSHYRESDFEEYRKKYVSNIFQNFNLVNSYTVYQNIELVLLLNGHKRKEVKKKVAELIEQVGLTKYRRTKVSKLSGGQKQRVAIARALAKETPIIVCDEPTANLDSRSAKSIIKLLKEISQDKLVIVVTHNFDEVAEVATRVVKMHDGKIVSDKRVASNDVPKNTEIKENKNIGFLNMIRLGIRNTFNIIPKFILIFIVFLFVATSLLSVYASMKKNEYEEGKLGANYYFNDTSDTRIIIKKNDGSSINNDDFTKISELKNIKQIIKNDILLDEIIWFESDGDNAFYFNGTLKDINMLDGNVDYGRMPEKYNEVVLLIDRYDYYFGDKVEDALKKTYFINGDKNSINVKVVGIKYKDDTSDLISISFGNSVIYAQDELIGKYMGKINRNHSTVIVNVNGKNHESIDGSGDVFDIKTSTRVPRGQAYVSENMNYACKDYACKNKVVSVNVKNLYYTDKIDLKITNVYTDKTIKNLLSVDKDDYSNGAIFMNVDDYDKLFNKESYQASVMADSVDNVDSLADNLEKLGFKTLQIRKTLNNEGADVLKILKIMKLVVTIILVITLFFISYFVIKLIIKSRNIYYSTLRILGANYKHIKRILDIELFTNASLAYVTYIVLIVLVKNKVVYVEQVANIVEYLKMHDYIIMYFILIIMSYLISTRYASKIFKKSAMKTYREEV